jgi:hypothetical protein
MWRPIAIALLAANLLFLAWAVWVHDPRPAAGASLQAAPAAGTSLESAAAASAQRAPQAARCVRLGPFADPNVAATVTQRLRAAALTSVAHEERQRQRDGFWVFVTAGDAAQQRRVLAQVRGAGIQDAYAMPDDGLFRISLGLYSERTRAEQRAAALRPLGLAPRVEEHFQERPVQWLEVPNAGEQLSASRLEGFGITDSEIGAFDCPAAPAAANAQ